MELWMTSEAHISVADKLRKVRNEIEKQFNTYLKEIEYENDQIDKLRQIIVIRDDDYRGTEGGEEIKKKRGKKIYSRSPRIDYNAFMKANDNERKILIYQTILESLRQLKEKKINNLEPIEEYVKEQIDILE